VKKIIISIKIPTPTPSLYSRPSSCQTTGLYYINP